MLLPRLNTCFRVISIPYRRYREAYLDHPCSALSKAPGPQITLPRHARLASIMIRPEMLNDLAARLSALGAAPPAKDLEKNARALLGGLFTQLDLVPREEFEVQAALLEKAQQRLLALEARIAELEKRG